MPVNQNNVVNFWLGNKRFLSPTFFSALALNFYKKEVLLVLNCSKMFLIIWQIITIDRAFCFCWIIFMDYENVWD